MTYPEHYPRSAPRPRFRSSVLLIVATLLVVALVSPMLAQSPATSAPTQATSIPVPPAETTPAALSSGRITPQRQTPTNRTPSIQTANQTLGQDSSQHRSPDSDPPPRIPEEPTSEFQRLVASTTGTPLPIYGASLFSEVPSTFAPTDNIPVTPGYLLGPGDEVRVQIYGQVNLESAFTIDRNGDIAFPDVGSIHLAGLPYSQLQTFLRSQLSRVYRNFDLNVNLGQLRSMQVFVVGQARRPGSYTISSLSTLLNALFASGGPLSTGSLRDVQVTRQGSTIVHFDLYDLLLHGDKSKDIPLSPGDTLFIPVVGPQVAVAGSVNVPAIYEVKPGTTMEQVLALAGGQSSVALGATIRLDRIFEHTMRSIVDVNLAKGENPALQTGDILTVAAILDRYKDAVTLRGNVAFPGRYVWHPGMRITDVVPAKDQLITAEFYRRLNALGTAASGFTTPGNTGSLQVHESNSGFQADRAVQSGAAESSTPGGSSLGSSLTSTNNVFPPTNDVLLSAPDINWSYAVIERLSAQTLTTSLIEFSPGRLFLNADQSQNLILEAGDVITFFSTADIKVPTVQQTRFVRLEGEFNAPGVYSVRPGDTLRSLILRAGGLTPDAYLYGSDFTRLSTRRIEQQRLNEYADTLQARLSIQSAANAAGVVSDRDAFANAAGIANGQEIVSRIRRSVAQGRIVLAIEPDSIGIDSLPMLALEDGDRFVVPRVPATVTVEGQVYSANAFLFQPGREERDYLHQAGGPNRQADARRTFILRADGSVFSEQYGNVSRARIFPGDTVVVPPRLQHSSGFRDFVDLTTIVGQFGILAAVLANL